jgi:site-specific DNA recombinase
LTPTIIFLQTYVRKFRQNKKEEESPKMIGIYARVSTDEQAKHGYSIADQLRLCREKAGAEEATEYIDDGYSGEFMGRPALDRLLTDLEIKPITAVIIYDPDRLARNTELQLSLAAKIETYAKLLFVTYEYDASPEGKLFFTMKAGISAYEKAKILARTSRGRISKALSGKVPSNRKPFGYDWDAEKCNYLVNEKEAETVKLIYALLLDGAGTKNICTKLNGAGVSNKAGRQWEQTALYKLITNEMYAGRLWLFQEKWTLKGQKSHKIEKRPKSEWVGIDVPAIVDRDTWERAQQQLKLNKKLSKRNTKYLYIFQGRMVCGLCGHGMTPTVHYTRGKHYDYYACWSRRRSRNCQNRLIPVSLEDELWHDIVMFVKGEKQLPANDTQSLAKRLGDSKQQLVELEQQRDTIMRWYRSGKIKAGKAEAELDKIANEIETLQNAIAALEDQKPIEVEMDVAAILLAKSPEEKKAALRKTNLYIAIVREGDSVRRKLVIK